MSDAWHQFGSDLTLSPTGDLMIASSTDVTQQRVLRRLLTNPGEYIWSTTYGAGLAQFIGSPVDANQIGAVIRGQIFNEAAVARSPEPLIEVRSDRAGAVYVQVTYGDVSNSTSQALAFSISNG